LKDISRLTISFVGLSAVQTNFLDSIHLEFYFYFLKNSLNSELLLSLESFNAMLAIISFVLKEAIVILRIVDLLAEIQALRECSENRKKNKQEVRVHKQ